MLMNCSYGNSLAKFDPKAEAKLRWKIDLYIVPTVALLYLFCFIDRANIGNARLAGLEKDLKMKGYDYNSVLSIFYISYIIFEVCQTPSQRRCTILTRFRFPQILRANGLDLVGSFLSSRSASALYPLAQRLCTTSTLSRVSAFSSVFSRLVCFQESRTICLAGTAEAS